MTDTPPPEEAACGWTVLRSIKPLILQRMLLYQGKGKYYLLGYNGEETMCSLLTFSHVSAEQLRVTEDPKGYSPRDAAALLQKIHELNAAEGGLQLVCEAFGLLGCFRFLECYYLLLITKRRPIGAISGHAVYGIADTVLVPLDQPLDSAAEKRYRKLFLTGIDLSKDFFFSYSYNICYTMQYNITHNEPDDPFESMFVWNEFLSREVRERIGSNQWVLPLVHGSWQQRCLAVFGQMITVTLIARRSRRFAGTRYLKRGVNQNGWVANEVETEQIVCLGTVSCSLSSVVQLRGSIPLFWGQDALTLNPRPNIVLQNTDPLYEATGKHFSDLHNRYGGPIVVLNLVKSHEKQPRETILRKEFGKAIKFLNDDVSEDDHIVYIPWDFKEHMSKDGRLFLRDIEPVIQTCIASTGFCAVGPATAQLRMRGREQVLQPQLQQGVLRTNCIDCLDRTNICQYAYGVVALGHQLHALGVLGTEDIDPDSSLAYQLMEMYETMGNVLAWQYGGSEAHGTFFDRMRGQSEAATQSRDMVTSLKRYYSNTMTDMEKQHAINLFLGNFVPSPNKPALWEFESDQYLHGGDPSSLQRSSSTGSLTFSLRFSSSKSIASNISTIDVDRLEDPGDQAANSPSSPAPPVGRFPIPKVSQTGDPDARHVVPVEQVAKSKKESSWSFTSIFKNPKTSKVEFRPPDSQQGSLVSFDEMLSACPIIHVRLHDSQSSTFRGLRGLSFHRSFTRIAEQDAMLDSDFDSRLQETLQVDESIYDSFSPEPETSSTPMTKPYGSGVTRVTSFTKHAKTGLQALKERSKKLRRLRSTRSTASGTQSDSKVSTQSKPKRFATFPRRAATPPSGAYWGSLSVSRHRHSGMTPPASARGSLRHRCAFAQSPQAQSPAPRTKPFSTEVALRYHSVPMGVHDVEEVAYHPQASYDLDGNLYCDVEPTDHIWEEYWSITPESVKAEIATGPSHSTLDGVWDSCTNLLGAQQGAGWSADDCWDDVFAGTLDSSTLKQGQLKRSLVGRPQLQRLSLKKSHDSDGPPEDVEVSITDSYYPGDSHRTKCEEGARQRIAPFSIERKSVTFVDSGTNGAQLEKWWGTN